MASVPGLGAIPRRLAVDAFWSLFGRREHEQLDFKRGVPDDVHDTIAAMAMTHGGLIVHTGATTGLGALTRVGSILTTRLSGGYRGL